MKYFILFLLCLFTAQNASALCEQGTIQIITKLKKGKVVYNHSLSRDEFAKVSPTPVSPDTVGLTVQQLETKTELFTRTKRDGEKNCAVIYKIIFEFGYDKIPVYIDKKYAEGSCPYQVTKKHEDYHVNVLQQAISFFEPDIKTELRKTLRKIKSQPLRSTKDLKSWTKEQQHKISKDMEPLITHIQKKMDEKNAAIDTPKSYRKTTAECPQGSW